jgi:uncharacterized protein YjdB
MAGPILILEVGHTRKLIGINADASGFLAPGPPITWATSNAAVATVDANGNVTGVGAGTCNITATNGSQSTVTATTVAARSTSQITVAVGDRT